MNNILDKLSLVISVYNEEDVLNSFWETLNSELLKLDINTEIIFVNDGSVDNSKEILNDISTRDNNDVKVIHFSRNYGHEAAMIAGVDNATGDAIICLDADGQHPPSIFQAMINSYKEGNHIVNMVRKSRADAGLIKRITSKLFYKILNKLSGIKFQENASDFFLISKKVANVVKKDFRERTRFLRGVIQIVGFKSSTVEFNAPKREFGESKYSISKLFVFSLNAMVTFSKAPLYLGLVLGCIFSIISFFVGIYSFYKWVVEDVPAGYTTIIIFTTTMFSILFFLLGIIGLYIGYLFEEIKKRPIYIIDEIIHQENN